ncbi:MAG: zinc dependent phospholipase C family protein [Erysipelotrichaceae bacterium]|nr:zinc dependent phospholipase C family protein [Erysipelotrichaceae bacterium]
MPATYTHGVYGKKVLEALDEQTRELIKKHRSLYDIGLSGPDILFFYQPLKSNDIKKIGYDMHDVAAREFFMKARRLIQESEDPEAALVYVLGFINHFVLDSECHPLVNEAEKQTGVTHTEIESELDAFLMREDGLDPVRTSVCDHIQVRKRDAQIIAPFFGVSEKEIREALRTLRLFLNIFVAPSEVKRKFIFFVMRKTHMYDHYHGLVFNREPNRKSYETVKQLMESMNHAIEASVMLINEYQRTLFTNQMLNVRYDRNFD